MATTNGYEVSLWKDEIERDESGNITHHPLNGSYTTLAGKDRDSYGYLTFGGHNLGASLDLDEVSVFYLEFTGEPEESYDREKWADPLRFEVLNRLTGINRCWYLSMINGPVEEIQGTLVQKIGVGLNQIVTESEKPYGYGYGFISRPFFEIPNQFLAGVVPFFWSKAVPGYPIEGYLMEPGQLNVLRQWNARPRDDQLFREVMDRTFVSFYTFPAEHRYFVFLTNKISEAELAMLIGLEDLQSWANEIGKSSRNNDG